MRTLIAVATALALTAFSAAAAAPSLAAPAQRFSLPDETQVNINVCAGGPAGWRS